jgi:hypothetical protein
VVVKLIIGDEPHSTTFAFYVYTSVVIELFLADALLALTAPFLVVSTIACEHLYVVNKVILTLFDIPENVDDCRLINPCFSFVDEAHSAWCAR